MDVGDSKIPLPGLSLADGHWKYGAKPMDVFNLINQGTPPESPGHNGAKMQAWGQMLSPKQVAEVTAYLISKNPKDFGG
jgi:cytochrome c oxidase cbb3-type subunit 3